VRAGYTVTDKHKTKAAVCQDTLVIIPCEFTWCIWCHCL